MLLSHSEAESFSMCEQRHYYAFGEKIAPKKQSVSLHRGNDGHSLMQAFFTEYRETHNWRLALKAVEAKYHQQLLENTADPNYQLELTKLLPRVVGFLENYEMRIKAWKIVAVEQEFRLPVAEDFTYPFRVDLAIEEKGLSKIVDWKFTYDFYKPEVVSVLPQIPKYIGALRALGFEVVDGYYGFIRYRAIKNLTGPNQIYNLHPVTPSRQRIMRSFQDFLVTLEQIVEMRRLSPEDWKAKTRRAGNNMICKSCGYAFLCQAELEGSDGKMIRHQDFVPNTYGYSEDTDGS
jgi:hypothetical protein